MKIALVDPSFFGADYDFLLLAMFKKYGYDVTLYGTASNTRAGTNNDYIPFFYRGNLLAKFSKQSKARLLLKGLLHIVDMWRFTNEAKKYDVIHFQWLPLPLIDLYFVKKIRKYCKVVFTMHDLVPFNGQPSSKIQTASWNKIFTLFDVYIVHTQQGKNALTTNKLLENKIFVIPHPITLFPTTGKKYANSCKIPKDATTVLMLGHIQKYKGIDFLIRALGLIDKKTLEKIYVIISGEPKYALEELFALAKENGVEKNILWDLRFIPKDEVVDLVTMADIMVFPYRAIEASGILSLAISYGKAVVASNIGVFKERISSGNNGFLVDIGSIEQIADCLRKLIENRTLLTKFQSEVKKLNTYELSWDSCAQETASVYKQLLS